MDYEDIKDRIAVLRREVAEINVRNRDYLKRRVHSYVDKNLLQERQLRLLQIRSEIGNMLQDKKVKAA
jgi:hypothetical protein